MKLDPQSASTKGLYMHTEYCVLICGTSRPVCNIKVFVLGKHTQGADKLFRDNYILGCMHGWTHDKEYRIGHIVAMMMLHMIWFCFGYMFIEPQLGPSMLFRESRAPLATLAACAWCAFKRKVFIAIVYSPLGEFYGIGSSQKKISLAHSVHSCHRKYPQPNNTLAHSLHNLTYLILTN